MIGLLGLVFSLAVFSIKGKGINRRL